MPALVNVGGLSGVRETQLAACGRAPPSPRRPSRPAPRAIELDPGFATAYGAAARCYSHLKGQGWSGDSDWEEGEVRRLALRVSTIGHDDALALCSAGYALARVCRETGTGAGLVDQALSINPNLAVGWANRGGISVFLGQHEAGIKQLTRGLRLNPLDPEIYWSEMYLAYAHLFQGRHDEALGWATRALTHRPNYRWTTLVLLLAKRSPEMLREPVKSFPG